MCSSTAFTMHYRGWDAAAERRDAQGGFHSPACCPGTRAWADGDFLWPRRSGPLGPLEPGARPQRGGRGRGGCCARALAEYSKPPPPKNKQTPSLQRAKVCSLADSPMVRPRKRPRKRPWKWPRKRPKKRPRQVRASRLATRCAAAGGPAKGRRSTPGVPRGPANSVSERRPLKT
jgi:hypothetical protein